MKNDNAGNSDMAFAKQEMDHQQLKEILDKTNKSIEISIDEISTLQQKIEEKEAVLYDSMAQNRQICKILKQEPKTVFQNE